MKNILILFLIFPLIFCSCSSVNKEITPISNQLSFEANISNGQKNFTYSVEINNENQTFLKCRDYGIDDLSMDFSGNSVNFKFKDLNYKTELSALPENFHLDIFHIIFSQISKKKPKSKNINNEFFIEEKCEKYNFKVYFGLSGLPIKIIEKNNNLTIIIKNAKVL